MKLDLAQLERTLSQFEAQALPDDHPVVPQLNDIFGDHTFFVDSTGLNVVEPIEASGVESSNGKIVNLAHWGDDSQTRLIAHEPEPTGIVVSLGSHH